MDEYNYETFDIVREEPPFQEFPRRLNVGGRAPDLPLEDLDTGKAVVMSSLWAEGPAVLEFGSFT